jgi:hypothetical protein
MVPREFHPDDILRVVISGTKAELRKISMSNEIVALKRHYEKAFYHEIVYSAVNGDTVQCSEFSADAIMAEVFGELVEPAKRFLNEVEE